VKAIGVIPTRYASIRFSRQLFEKDSAEAVAAMGD